MKHTSLHKHLLGCTWTVVAVFSFISCSSPKAFRPWDPGYAVVSKIDSICNLQMENGHFPGIGVAVASGNRHIWTKGYGYADLEQKKAIDPQNHLFRIGSISKSVTAAALAREYERGRINLDIPISTYYPDCPADKGNLTLRQTAGHLAGIRHYRGLEFLSNIHYTNVTEPLEVFIHDTLLYEPGEKFSYSTYGWTLVSAVMEKAIDIPFVDIVAQEVSEPLYLADLKPDQKDSTAYHRVTFYEYQDSMHQVSPVVDISNKWAGGGYLCSPEDLARFGYALAEPGYLKKSTIDLFTTSQTTNDGKPTSNGIGFFNGTDDDGRKWFGHSGGSVGGTSKLMVFPEQDLVVVTLINLSGADTDDLAMRIAEVILSGKSKR